MLNEYDMRWYIVHDRYDYTGPKKDEKQPHKKRTLEVWRAFATFAFS